MHPLVFKVLAQMQPPPWEEAPLHGPSAPPPRPLSFKDLQQSIHQYNEGAPDNSLRNGLLIVLAFVALIALILHYRQRRKDNLPPDSEMSLARELAHVVPFPWGTKFLLKWVARSANVPFATLLLSAQAFDQHVETWAAQPTFALVRRWGITRLHRLKTILFDS